MEALERRSKLMAVATAVFILLWSQCKAVEGHRNSTKMSYVCPPKFIRLGHSCYFFSERKLTWQDALFFCKDYDSNLTVPARWEDRNLRNYLNKAGVEKASWWIGGIYDYTSRAWKWGGELRQMRYQSFSKMKKLTPEELQWQCIAMMPELLYRWAPRTCIEPRQFICQTRLRKVPKSKLKDLRRRWQKMGKMNEITAPSASREVNDPRVNDVTINPVLNPKSFDLRPSPLRLEPKIHPIRNNFNKVKKRSRSHMPVPHRLTKPFQGYKWNRRNPEASYIYNAELLRSGQTGLSPNLVKSHLARLQRLRDKQIARRKRLRDDSDWLNNEPKQVLAGTHARTYTVDNNISALHPKLIVEEFVTPQPQINLPTPVPNAG